MYSVLSIIQSFIEIMGIYLFLITIDQKNHIGYAKGIVTCAFVAVLTFFLDFNHVPFQFAFSFFAFLLVVFMLKRTNPLDLFIDGIAAVSIFFLLEFFAIITCRYFNIRLSEIQPFILIIPALIFLLGAAVVRNKTMDTFLYKYYRSNRRLILGAALDIIILYCIIINIWNKDQSLFGTEYVQLAILILCYFILNIVLIVIIIKNRTNKDKLKTIMEYKNILAVICTLGR